MPKVTYVADSGELYEVQGEYGKSVMRTALENHIPGIVGECGGEMQCSTCHVYVDENNTCTLPPVSEDEDEMLDAAICERTENSRLSCQIKCTAETDGIVVHLPKSQY